MVSSAVLLTMMVVVAADIGFLELDYHAKIGIPLLEKLKSEKTGGIPESWITGGRAVSDAVYPYLVGVIIDLTNGHASTCGATMLSNTRSITAAHCWMTTRHQARLFILAFGTNNILTGGTRVITDEVDMHPEYNTRNLHNDIAVITHSWVQYTRTIRPVSLSGIITTDLVGTWAMGVGFRDTTDNPEISQEEELVVSLQIITNMVCAQFYESSVITESNLCVEMTGTDSTWDGAFSGSLIIIRNNKPVLIGISSFESEEGNSEYPAVFTRVTSFISWIEEQL